MKILLYSLLYCCFFYPVFSQVTGKLTRSDGQPVAYVNVLLLNSTDSTLVKTVITNEMGAYMIGNVQPGSYFLRFSSIAYETWHSSSFELTATRKKWILGYR